MISLSIGQKNSKVILALAGGKVLVCPGKEAYVTDRKDTLLITSASPIPKPSNAL